MSHRRWDKAISTLPLNAHQWHLITVTYTEATYNKRIYINSVLTFDEDNTGNIGYNGRPLFIGAFKTNLGDIIFPFKGNIDEVKIWQKALTRDEIIRNVINPIIGNEDSLSGFWNFNEGIGDTLYDNSIYNIKGIINGATWDGGYFLTSITVDTPVGSQRLEVSSTVGFSISDNIVINRGGANEETNIITGFGSMLLQTPLQFNHLSGELIVKLNSTSVNGNYIDIPNDYTLYHNYPNPFNPSTTIEFTLPKSEFVELKVYNILGKEVTTLVSKKLNQGNHTFQFDGRNLASGIYYYQLVSGEYREVKKMVLMK